jgi:hypothetical protein
MKGKCCRSCGGCSKRGSGNAGGMGSGERNGVREVNPGQVNTGKSKCDICMDEKLALYKREPREGLMKTFESSQAAAKFACSKRCETGDKQRNKEEGRKKNEEEEKKRFHNGKILNGEQTFKVHRSSPCYGCVEDLRTCRDLRSEINDECLNSARNCKSNCEGNLLNVENEKKKMRK